MSRAQDEWEYDKVRGLLDATGKEYFAATGFKNATEAMKSEKREEILFEKQGSNTMKIAKGETITVDDQECTLTKVSQHPGGTMKGNIIRHNRFRLYYKRGNGTQGHNDCIIDDETIAIELG